MGGFRKYNLYPLQGFTPQNPQDAYWENWKGSSESSCPWRKQRLLKLHPDSFSHPLSGTKSLACRANDVQG
jgi:hypothetical protein